MTPAIMPPVAVAAVWVGETMPDTTQRPTNSRGSVLSWAGVALGLLATRGDQVGLLHRPLLWAALVLSALSLCRCVDDAGLL